VSHDHASPGECADFLDQIVYLIDNELDDADIVAVKIHLEACSPCLEKYDLQRTVKAIVARSCSESAPQELRQRVLFRIREVQLRITET
jgi:mycothiol system anti-sigma-R factor